jgi:predicted ATPase
MFDQQQGKLVELEPLASDTLDGYEENESLLSQIADMRNRIPTLTRREIERWNLHHDIHVERGSTMRKPATTQFTRKLASDGSNLVTVLHTHYSSNREFRELIDDGMKAGFGEEYLRLEFQPAAAQQIQLAVQWKSSSYPHAGSDLSDGTLRFLFLLTVLSHPEPAALIAIDEPEAGLHPSMLPILAEYATAASEQTQVVLTSHSPEFLDAFTNSSPMVTLCHWEDGQTLLFQIESDALEKWLSQYRLGRIFTRGDLETLALSKVEPIDEMASQFGNLPSEDAAMAEALGDPKDKTNG